MLPLGSQVVVRNKSKERSWVIVCQALNVRVRPLDFILQAVESHTCFEEEVHGSVLWTIYLRNGVGEGWIYKDWLKHFRRRA